MEKEFVVLGILDEKQDEDGCTCTSLDKKGFVTCAYKSFVAQSLQKSDTSTPALDHINYIARELRTQHHRTTGSVPLLVVKIKVRREYSAWRHAIMFIAFDHMQQRCPSPVQEPW